MNLGKGCLLVQEGRSSFVKPAIEGQSIYVRYHYIRYDFFATMLSARSDGDGDTFPLPRRLQAPLNTPRRHLI